MADEKEIVINSNETGETIDAIKFTSNPFEEKNQITEEELIKREAAKPQNTTDPVIKEKDEKIIEEGKTNTKPDQSGTVPTATPKDIPASTETSKANDNPPVAEVKFANKTSENIYKAIVEGREDELREYLNKKQTLTNIDKMPPADLLKLKIKLENPDHTPEDVNDLFEEKFTVPEKPIQNIEEADEDYEQRLGKYEKEKGVVERRIARESRNAITELKTLNESLVLPEIKTPSNADAQPTQKDLEAATAARESYLNSIEEGLNKFNGFNATYKDKDVSIPVAYNLTNEQKIALKSEMENFNLDEFVKERWLTKDGKFNTTQLAEDLFNLKHGKEVTEKLINEAGNKRYAEALKSIKNVDFSGTQRNVLPVSDMERYEAGVRKALAS